MKNLHVYCLAALAMLGSAALSALGDYSITYVGTNPYGIPTPGGTGSVSFTEVTETFTSIADIPLIVDGSSSLANTAGVHLNGAPVITQTLHVDAIITNSTGQDWTDFHMIVDPIDANPDLQVTFANVTNLPFTVTPPSVNSLTLENGLVPNGTGFELMFDLQIAADIDSSNLFAIHQFPSVNPVPAPSASTLSVIGGALLILLQPRFLRSRIAA